MSITKTLFLIWVIILCSDCTDHRISNDNFQLIILNKEFPNFDENIYSLSSLKKLGENDYFYVINLEKIETYNWHKQTITLTKPDTDSLLTLLSKHGELSEEIKAINDMKRTLGWGNEAEMVLQTVGFIVKSRGEVLYGGVFIDATMQTGVNYPVARVSINNDKLTIALLPVHIPFNMIDPIDEKGDMREPSIASQVSHDVQQLNVKDNFFTKWTYELSTSNTANEFRQTIRDVNTKKIFNALKKLK